MIINDILLLKIFDLLIQNKEKILNSSINQIDKEKLLDIISKIQNKISEIRTIIVMTKNEEEKSANLNSLGVLSLYNNITKICLILIKDHQVNYYDSSLYRLFIDIINEKVIDNKLSEIVSCPVCNSNMEYCKKFYKCKNCQTVKNNDKDDFNIDKVHIENKPKNDNIIKHLNKNLSHIYGECWDDSTPPEVREEICEYLRNYFHNTNDIVHYTYEIHEALDQMHNIVYIKEDKKKIFYPRDFKIYSNTFIKDVFPDIEIPKLTSEHDDLLRNTFLSITAEYQDMIVSDQDKGSYNINYLFNIHRILFHKLRNYDYVRNLLRFIYIQKSLSFKKKDKKLFKVNKRNNCFDRFFYTPENVYINEDYYNIN